MNSEEDEFKRIEAEAKRRAAVFKEMMYWMGTNMDEDDDTQVYVKPWVGLTWEDMPEEHAGDSNFLSGARWAEARLKERNTWETAQQPRQWVGLDEDEIRELYGKDLNYRDGNYVRYAKSVEAKLKERNT